MADPLDRRLVIVTGKGGVGKSTLAAAVALSAAEAGRRTALCEIGGAGAISRRFGIEPDSEGVALGHRLTGLAIEPEQAMRDYVLMALKVRALRDLLFRSRAFTYLAAATPGLAELVTIGKVWQLLRPDGDGGRGRFDRVVVDAPASGHGLALLESPSTFAAVTSGGPLERQARALERMLRDRRRTAVVIVASPEEIAVNETLELDARIRELGITPALVVLNRVRERALSEDELAAIVAAAGEADGVATGLAALEARMRSETEQAERLMARSETPTRQLSALDDPPLSAAGAIELARGLR